jgi:hypothetical protein
MIVQQASPSNESSPRRAAPDPEVETQIAFATNPHDDRPDLAQREASIRWLVDHSARAFPVVLAAADQFALTTAKHDARSLGGA